MPRSSTTKISLIGVVLLLGITSSQNAFATERGQLIRGNKAFSKGDYDKALEGYEKALAKNPESDIANYNAGSAYYKKGDYAKAIEHLNKASLTSDPKLKEKSAFNLGLAKYKLAGNIEKTDPQSAEKMLQSALTDYEKLLKDNPKDPDVKRNYDAIKKKLEELKKKNNSQKNDQQDKSDPDKKKDDKQKSDKQSEQNKSDDQSKSSDNKKDESQQQNSSKDSSQNEDKQNSSQQNQSEENKKDQQSKSEQQNKSSDDKEQQQQGQESNKDNQSQEKSGQEKQQNASDKGDKSSGSQSGQANAVKAGEMTKEEAKQLLDNYQNTEEPKGILYLYKGKSSEAPVTKDW